MATTEYHEAAERRMRDLLDENALPAPDEVEYRDDSVVFLWHESKAAVVIDLTDPPPD